MLPSHLERRHLAAAAAGCVALAVVGLVDPSRHALGPPCPLRTFTGLDCPLCGATRSTHALLRRDLAAALDFNVLFVLVLPLVVLAAGSWLLWGHPPSWMTRAPARWAVLAAAGAFMVVRNLPWSPLDVLAS